MNKWIALLSLVLVASRPASGVDLVRNGIGMPEIVVAVKPLPWVKTAAEELQAYLRKMSGAELPIVTKVSPAVETQIYVGASEHTAKLDFTLDDVIHGGFKIVAARNYVIAAGKDIDNGKSFAMFRSVANRQEA
ncbi:MAG: hypothetical protein HY736_00740 [Verrucomicrobia bacterium]|nr:hypothetical protein [Verrucomicrobiota bacterium]